MEKKKTIIYVVIFVAIIAILVISLWGKGKETYKNTSTENQSFVEETGQSTETGSMLEDSEMVMMSEEAKQVEDEDIIVTKEEMEDGVYLICEEGFQRISEECPGYNEISNIIVDDGTSEWFSVAPGDKIAFKGNYIPNQEISVECSVDDYYTFPYSISLIDYEQLAIYPMRTTELALVADLVVIDNIEIPINIQINEEYHHYIEEAEWEIVQTTTYLGGGGDYCIKGNFYEGYQAKVAGYNGTDYVELEMEATCHIIEMPKSSFDHEHYLNWYLETTKDGYFILTIPETAKSGYYEVSSGVTSDSARVYVQIK